MKFDSLNIRNKILVGIGVAIFLMFFVSIIVYVNVSKLEDTSKWVKHTQNVITQGNRLVGEMVNMETGMRGFLVTGDEKFLEPYIAGEKNFKEILSNTKELVKDNPSQVKLLENIALQSREWIDQVAKVSIDKRRELKKERAPSNRFKKLKNLTATYNDLITWVKKGTGKKMMDGIRESIKRFNTAEKELMALREKEAQNSTMLTKVVIVVCTLFTAVLGFICAYVIARRISTPMIELVEIFQEMALGDLNKEVNVNSTDEVGKLGTAFNKMVENLKEKVALANQIALGDLTMEVKLSSEMDALGKSFQRMTDNWSQIIGEMKDNSLQLTSSANQISAAATEQSRNILQQTDSINNFSAVLTELSSTANEMSRSASNMVETSRQAIDLANLGNEAIQTSQKSIEEIRVTNNNTSEKFTTLVGKVENIAQVMGTITKIADKTNLLSVNASIEAVKAGEFGKGFSVVAAEIRRLADQTVTATEEIKEFISDIQKSANAAMMSMEKSSATTKEGTDLVKNAGISIGNLIGAVRHTGPMLDEVRNAIEQQMESTLQLTESIKQIQQSADENKISAEQTSEITGNLSEMAQKQLGIVQQFKLSSPLKS